MVNPVSSVRKASKLIYSEHSLVIILYPVPDKNTRVCLTGSLKNISVCKICSAANFDHQHLGHYFHVFSLVPGLSSWGTTNQSGSYHLSGIISGMSHQKWLFMENCMCVVLTKWHKEAWQLFHKPWLPCCWANGFFPPIQTTFFHTKMQNTWSYSQTSIQ